MSPSKIKTLFLCSIFSMLLFYSCNVSLVPSRSEDAIAKVARASQACDSIYDVMIASRDKAYGSYSSGYADIKDQIEEILKADSSRNKPKVILKMAGDIQTKFLKYEQDHLAAGSLNSAQLRTYKDYMHALWASLYTAETHFK